MKTHPTLLALAVLAPMLVACAPKPDDVCQHVVDLMKKDLGDQADAMSEEQIAKIKETCVKNAEKEKQAKGPIEYSKQTKCVMAAESLEDLRECEEKEKAEKQ
jgi:hypothetical protein